MNRTVPLAGVVSVVLTLVALLTGCTANSSAGAAPPSPPAATASATEMPRTTSATKTPPARPRPPAQPQPLPVAPGAGSLPQTQQFPSTRSTAFRNAMTDVWLAVTTGQPDYGRPAFFPEAAYAKVKAIGNPEADWTGRLWLDFGLDVGAAHRVVGSHARLLRVDMAPDSEAAWVPPGYCYNYVGYWHINGARLVYYDAGGQERSIGIASLISWRGVWYVVHFGGVIRPAIGIVDDPEAGPGVPGPAGGC